MSEADKLLLELALKVKKAIENGTSFQDTITLYKHASAIVEKYKYQPINTESTATSLYNRGGK